MGRDFSGDLHEAVAAARRDKTVNLQHNGRCNVSQQSAVNAAGVFVSVAVPIISKFAGSKLKVHACRHICVCDVP